MATAAPELNPSPRIPAATLGFFPTTALLSAAILALGLATGVSLLQLPFLDNHFTLLLNTLSTRSEIFDASVGFLVKHMFSTLFLITLAWYAWFQSDQTEPRARILVGVLVSLLAGLVSRTLQMLLPTHVRPLHNAALNFRLPLHLNPETLNHWSSFPSDHASVFFAIATTIFLVNRRIGVLAFVIATGLCLVRIYLGLHYLSDIVGGAALGVLFVALTQPLRRLDTIRRLVAPRTTPRPLFYAAAFYLCFGVTTLFSDYRDLASGISPLLKAHLHH